MLRQDLFLVGPWLLLAQTTNYANSFQPQTRSWQRIRHRFPLLSTSDSIDHDFSSPYFWDRFYEEQSQSTSQEQKGEKTEQNDENYAYRDSHRFFYGNIN